MLIIDWSADVCSSDLPCFELLRTQGVLDAWLASDGDDLTWALGFLRSVAPLAPHEVAALIDDFLERRPDRVRDVFGTLRFIDPKADARPLADSLIAALNRSAPEDWENGGNDWDDYYARSEEHTSELQSLMRISYAVFCLKKTNKTITKKKNTK